MKYRLKPKEALALWNMIAGESDDARQPTVSKTSPKLTKRDCEPLVAAELITLSKHGRSNRLELTDKAWAWAADAVDVELVESKPGPGAAALQGLLRRLLPFLKKRNVSLAELFSSPGSKPRPSKRARAAAPAKAPPTPPRAPRVLAKKTRRVPIGMQIEQACLALAQGSRKARVRLSALRKRLDAVERRTLDQALLKLSDEGRLALYRDDNTAALTDEDHRAALSVGGAPRHLVYLEI